MANPNAEALALAKLEKLKFNEFMSTKFRGDGKQDPHAHILLFRSMCIELTYLTAEGAMTDAHFQLVKKLFFRTLIEKALIWYDSCVFANFNELCTGFLRHYSGSHGVSGDLTLFNTLTWSQGETAREFKTRLKTIADRLALPETLLKHRFIHGLPPRVGQQLLPFYDNTMDSLLAMAQNILHALPQTSTTVGAGAVGVNYSDFENQGESAVLQADMVSLRREFEDMKVNMDGLYASYDESYPEGYDPGQYGVESAGEETYYAGPPNYRYNTRRPGRFSGRFRDRFRGFRNQGQSYHDYKYIPNVSTPRGIDFARGRTAGRSHCKFCNRRGHLWSSCWDLEKKLDSGEKTVFQ